MTTQQTPPWHAIPPDAAARQLASDTVAGLAPAEAARRLLADGPNEIEERGGHGPWRIAAEQFTGLLVIVLLVAAAISLALGDLKNAVAIAAIVVLNAAFGFVQEYRAERAIAALKRMAMPLVRVRRGGVPTTVPSRELVAGDLVLLEAGNVVPADARLVNVASLRVQEAALTGESEAVEKDPALLADDTAAIGDRRNLVFAGTVVTYGRGEALVVATGNGTELGRVAALIGSASNDTTPLQRRLAGVARQLAVLALVIVALIAAFGLLRGEPLRLVFLTAVSMAVAAVPEGLAAVVTIALALGARRMLQRKALVRKLAAVEALGSVTVICTDKTGTLTENRMSVAHVELPGGGPIDLHRAGAPGAPLALLLAAGALCSDAEIVEKPDRSLVVTGDPTEAALVTAALGAGLSKRSLETILPREDEVPFDSDRKRMSTVHRIAAPATHALSGALQSLHGGSDAARLIVTKGAVDRLLEVCTSVATAKGQRPLDDAWRRSVAEANDRAAARGMRVLGIAAKTDAGPRGADAIESGLTFLGLVGLIDPPRAEARDAIASCRAAGIRPVMITGDHPLTATAIARDLGIASAAAAVTGPDLAAMDDRALDEVVARTTVYARVAPEHKLRIVSALQRRGEIVAMTGDGVNDAPALKQADIGVAMGVTGTDVAKGASDAVLLDDNFATIVAAVREGRVIYDNIRKFITFLVSSNSAELWVMLLAPLAGLPAALLPLQILWINLVTDGPAALALSVEPAERDAMRRPPYRPDEPLLTRAMKARVFWVGALMGAVSLSVAWWYWRAGSPAWQTMVFTTLALSQMANVLATRSMTEPIWRIGWLSNRPLAAAVAGTVILQLVVIYLPFAEAIFSTVPLGAFDLVVAFAASSIVFVAVELHKWWRARAVEAEPSAIQEALPPAVTAAEPVLMASANGSTLQPRRSSLETPRAPSRRSA